jgi:aldose 1-epimerase
MVHILQNKDWQVGILPETGASIAFGRMRYSGAWVDVLRPTAEANYSNPSKTSSFLMLPWANRIRDGVLRFEGQSWQLQTTKDDGTARHGDVRKRVWQVIESSDIGIRMSLDSWNFPDFNFPFRLSAELSFHVEDRDFVWELTLKNADKRSFPAGFGFHPYFMRPSETWLQIPCNQQYILINAMPEAAPISVKPELDFREARPITDAIRFDDLLTEREGTAPLRLIYKDWQTALEIHADSIYEHVILYSADDGTIAVEPQTNANDGFNLRENGIAGGGIFVLEPSESIKAAIRLRLTAYKD